VGCVVFRLYVGRMKKIITLFMLLSSMSGLSQEAKMIEINIDETQKEDLVKLNYLLKDKAIFKKGDDALLDFYKEKSKYEILDFEANCEFRIAMTPDDLMRANLTKLAEKWNGVPTS